MRIALAALALFFVVATALPFIREPYWWVRMFDFPRVQIALGALVTLGLVVAFFPRDSWFGWAVLVLLGASVLYQLWRILPYTPLHGTQVVEAREEVPPERMLRLVVTNVLMDNREGARWLEVIRAAEPDLVVAVEADDWWAEQARALGDAYPHRVEVPQDNTYGMLVYSRFPFHGTEVRRLVEDDVPSIWTTVELPSGERVRCVFLHPRPPRPDVGQSSAFRDAELVLVAREVEQWEDGPVIVAGDLNDVAWSHTTKLFQRISGLLDPRIGRGLYSTFNAKNPLLRWPLDHVFHSDDLALVDLRLLDHVGSDHFPIMIELAYEPSAPAEQQAPAADAEDREESQEVLEDAREEQAEETPEERRERKEADR